MKEQSFQLSRRRTLILLAIITLLGAALRLYKINYQSLWYDELHSIIPTDPQNSVQSIIEYCKTDQPPAFFLFIHYFFKVFGYSEENGRIASALIGIIGIPILYLLGKELHGRAAGLFAALLVSVNYFHIYYSQELRFYSMAFLFSATSYLFFIRSFKNGRISDFIGYIICTVVLLYTHYYGLVIYAVQAFTFVLLILFYKRDQKFLLAGFVSGLIILIAFIPWMPVILGDLGIASFWIKKPQPFFFADYFYNYFGKDALVTLALVILIVIFLKSLKTRETIENEVRPLYLILIVWLIFSYLAPYIKSVIGTPVLHIRYTIITLPAWILIFTIGWTKIKKINLKYFFVGVITLSAICNLFLFRKYYTKIQKQQFREVAQVVNSRNFDHTPIATDLAWHFNFYFRNTPHKAGNLSSIDFSSVDKFWLLYAEFFTPQEKESLLKNFSETFEIQEEHNFYKSAALLMTRKKLSK